MASKRGRRWFKGLIIAAVCLIVIPVLIFGGVLIALTYPSVQQKAVTAAARILTEKTGIPVSVGKFSVGLPANVLLGDVFVGDAQNDTLAFIGCLDARIDISALPDSIAVNSLDLSGVVAHTGELIPSLRIDGRIGRLSAGVQSFGFNNLYFPITDAVLEDADIALELIDEAADEDAPADTSATAIAIDLQALSLKNVRFSLEPMGLKLDVGQAETSTLVDLEAMCFTVRNLDIADTDFSIAGFDISVGRLSGDALVDMGNDIIRSGSMFVSIPQMDAQATLSNTSLDLKKMLVSTTAKAKYAGSDIMLDADYDIDDEVFSAGVDLGRTDLAAILGMAGNEIVVAGHLDVSGRGLDPMNYKMVADVRAQLDSCRYNTIDVSGIRLEANLDRDSLSVAVASPVHYRDSSMLASLTHDSRLSINDFLGALPHLDFETRIADVNLMTADDSLDVSGMDVRFKTHENLTDAAVSMPGINLSADLALHALEIPGLIPSFSDGKISLAQIDSVVASIPKINIDLAVEQDNPFRSLLQKNGLDMNKLTASLHSLDASRKLLVSLRTPALEGEYSIPAINADLDAVLVDCDPGIRLDGELKLADLVYDGKNFGDRKVTLDIMPDKNAPEHLIAHAVLDDIPLQLAEQFVELPPEIDIQGEIRARATVSGLPDRIEIFAGVTPVGVTADYKPYDVRLSLGEQEITMENNRVNLNGLRLFAADSTFVSMDGGIDLETMQLDVKLKSDSFEPVKLPQDGPIPVYGRLLAGIDGTVTGPVDSLLAKVDVSILPQTDITYPIDEKNLAQVYPAGTVKVGYGLQTGLDLGGQIDIPKGKIFFSPKIYPMMPFNVDAGSCIKFNGDLNSTIIAISASQGSKSTYKPVGEASRMVDFVTGVKVGGTLDKIEIGFYLDAPKDAAIHKELAEMPEENREGLAAVLLATGMYASESNEAVQMGGYALSSILQSRLNAAASNKLGGKINLDFGVAKGRHGRGVETTDYVLNISKSFFDDKLNVMLGGSVSDNVEVNRNSTSLINNLSAEYKLDRDGALKARLFSMKDFNNIVDGELGKSGVGVLYDRTFEVGSDSLDRSLDLKVEGNIVYRTNNQLGPDAAVSLSKVNLFKRGDVFTTKVRGAYYWNLNRRQKLDPARNDTYILGADFALDFPYLQLGDRAQKYSGQTLYRLGYLNEIISGDYGMHKLYGGVNYSIRQNKYVTHTFSPLYLSVVLADGDSDKLSEKMDLNDLYKLFTGNEFVPSAGYSFSYNDYRNNDRVVNTALDIRVKESANLISGIMAAFGRDFNEKNKTLFGVNYDQFVKLQFELRNKFKLSEKLELATRAMAGAVINYGNSVVSPLSESYSIGGPNSLRAFLPRSIGPGDFHNEVYSAQVFHTGDMKLELNAELRFPIFWKVNGAVFVDAGNVWNQEDPKSYMTEEEIEAVIKGFNMPRMYASHFDPDTFLKQIALGTGAGLRLDYESIVIRLDLGIAIHAPFDTGRTGYYNIPNLWRNGMILNFGIGYPF